MLDAITVSQIGMLYDQFRLQSISENISNMRTPAYKRQFTESVAFNQQLAANFLTVGQHMHLNQINSQGALEASTPHHLAINGEGFFCLQSNQGIFYTRRGDFSLNERGELANPQGYLVLGKNGPLHLDNPTFDVNTEGVISSQNQIIGQLNLVRFPNPASLRYQGNGLYTGNDTSVSIDHTTQVLQGFIEGSNSKSLDEMVDMIQVSRHFEASQRVMRTADEMLSKAINSLGEDHV